MLIVAWGAGLAIGYLLASQRIVAAIFAARPADASASLLLAVLFGLFVIGGPALLGLLAGKTFTWVAARWPRQIIPLEFRGIEPHLLTHWIRASVDGEDTWFQVGGLRRRVTGALSSMSRGTG